MEFAWQFLPTGYQLNSDGYCTEFRVFDPPASRSLVSIQSRKMVGNETENQAKASNHKNTFQVQSPKRGKEVLVVLVLQVLTWSSIIHSQFHLLGSTT